MEGANSQTADSPELGTALQSGGEVPSVLERARFESRRLQFAEELQPVGALEHAVVSDLARHAAAAERWSDAVGAVQRHAARSLPALATAGLQDDFLKDAALACATSVEAADRCERHGLAHSRAFYRALRTLEELQARRVKDERLRQSVPPPGFASEVACEVYLAGRFARDGFRCSRCGASDGYYLPARRAWECRACGVQAGLRAGTVMARSPIPLLRWFEAIRWLLFNPRLSIGELALKVGIRRPTTLRAMARRIREAMSAEDATERLAGLDVHYAECSAHLSEALARRDAFQENQPLGQSPDSMVNRAENCTCCESQANCDISGPEPSAPSC